LNWIQEAVGVVWFCVRLGQALQFLDPYLNSHQSINNKKKLNWNWRH